MRWKRDIPPAKGMIIVGVKGPDIGEKKEKIRFAWLPTKVGKTHKVWLEAYIEVWEFRQYQTRQYEQFLLGSRWHQVSIQNQFITTTGWKLK